MVGRLRFHGVARSHLPFQFFALVPLSFKVGLIATVAGNTFNLGHSGKIASKICQHLKNKFTE
jgi:hypothetical protein